MPAESGIGAWAADDLAATVVSNFGAGSDAGLPPEVRMLSAVAELARKRRGTANAQDDPLFPAVFLLRPEPPDHLVHDVRQFPMMDNGLEPITGRLWFVNEVVSGRCLQLDVTAADADLFVLVSDDADSADVPAVLFDPRPNPPTLRFYKSGMGHPDDCRVLPFDPGRAIDLDQIFQAVTLIHENLLVTPGAQDTVVSLWEDPDRGWPAKRAEALIQSQLRTGLTIAFAPCTVRPEQPGVPGRLDLHIERHDPGALGHVIVFAVLELKVLRGFWSTGTPVSDADIADWIDKGVRQAAAYRDDRHALAAALCCFDMRHDVTGEHCFEAVLELSTRLGVALRAWHLFSSFEAYRAYVTG